MKNAVLKCNQLDAGWYVAKNSSNGGGPHGGRYHIFKVEDEMMPEVVSLCGSVDYRNINSRCVKRKVDDPADELDSKVEKNVCQSCLNNFKRRFSRECRVL